MQSLPNLLKLQGQPAQWSAHPTSTSKQLANLLRQTADPGDHSAVSSAENKHAQRLQYIGKKEACLEQKSQKILVYYLILSSIQFLLIVRDLSVFRIIHSFIKSNHGFSQLHFADPSGAKMKKTRANIAESCPIWTFSAA